MTKDHYKPDRDVPRPEPKPDRRPAQDQTIRKDSGNQIRTTDWNKPPRPPKEKNE